MDWYIVIKKIKGNRYYYYQKTYRAGKQVKTQNIYYGPVNKVARPPSRLSTGWNTTAISTKRVRIPPTITYPDLTGAKTIPIPFPDPAKARIDPDTVDNALKIVLKQGVTTHFLDLGWDRHKDYEHKNWRTFDKIDKVTAKFGITFTKNSGGNWYDPNNDTINIIDPKHWYATKGNTVEYRYYRTRCHELVHWTGGKKRLDRIDMDRWGDEKYALEELTAELGACMLMNLLGYSEGENQEFHAQYFQHWLERAGDRDEAIKKATARAKQAIEYILEHGDIA